MKIIDLFPTSILGEKLEGVLPHNLDFYKEKLNSLALTDMGPYGLASKDQNVLDLDIFHDLKYKILSYSRMYLDNLNHQYEDVQIGSCWVNILNKNQSIHGHDHCNSYISGVFYFDYSSPIMFENPHNPLWKFTSQEKEAIEGNPRSFYDYPIFPEPNLLLIFPSWLRHSVTKSDKDNRLSIAFNIIPKGEFGPETGRLYFN